MLEKLKYIIKGIGSLIDLFPSTDYNKFVYQKSLNERMSDHWQRTGQHIERAISHYEINCKAEK